MGERRRRLLGALGSGLAAAAILSLAQARAIGLTMPAAMLIRADRVIE